MAEENQSGFKVTDRRLFNADGSMREDAQIEERTVVAVAPGPAPDAHSIPTQPLYEEEPLPEEAEPEQTLFTEFLMGVASSAFIYLGMVEHPATGRRQVDLMAAKETIEMLLMLRDKTNGNLTRGEEKFYDDLLADLRMQFVALNRRPQA